MPNAGKCASPAERTPTQPLITRLPSDRNGNRRKNKFKRTVRGRERVPHTRNEELSSKFRLFVIFSASLKCLWRCLECREYCANSATPSRWESIFSAVQMPHIKNRLIKIQVHHFHGLPFVQQTGTEREGGIGESNDLLQLCLCVISSLHSIYSLSEKALRRVSLNWGKLLFP